MIDAPEYIKELKERPQTLGLRTRWHEDLTITSGDCTVSSVSSCTTLTISDPFMEEIEALKKDNEQLNIRISYLESWIRNEGGRAQTLGLRTRPGEAEDEFSELFQDL